MKVLVIDNIAAGELDPKAGSYIGRIGECLKTAGCDVTYLLPRCSSRRGLDKLWLYLLFYVDLSRCDYSRYDLIYINHYSFAALPLLLRQKAIVRGVIHWHGTDLLPRELWKRPLFRLLMALMPGRFQHVVPSKYFRRVLQEKLPQACVDITPSGGVDLGVFKPSCEPKSSACVRLGFASGLDEGKGFEAVKRLVSRLPELEKMSGRSLAFNFVDYGSLKGALDHYVKTWPNKVVSHPVYHPAKIADFYRQNDVLLFPTKREAESLGLVPLEAMACGIPVVAPNRYACPEYVIPGDSGELYDPEDPDDLERKLLLCLSRLENYRPRPVVERSYSSALVVEFYRARLAGQWANQFT